MNPTEWSWWTSTTTTWPAVKLPISQMLQVSDAYCLLFHLVKNWQWTAFYTPDSPPPLLMNFFFFLNVTVDHFDHIKKVAGAGVIGFGGDYDGVTRLVGMVTTSVWKAVDCDGGHTVTLHRITAAQFKFPFWDMWTAITAHADNE